MSNECNYQHLKIDKIFLKFELVDKISIPFIMGFGMGL
jgi:hypothetical protein